MLKHNYKSLGRRGSAGLTVGRRVLRQVAEADHPPVALVEARRGSMQAVVVEYDGWQIKSRGQGSVACKQTRPVGQAESAPSPAFRGISSAASTSEPSATIPPPCSRWPGCSNTACPHTHCFVS